MDQRRAAAGAMFVHQDGFFRDRDAFQPSLGLAPFNKADQRVALKQEIRRVDPASSKTSA
jgi:hypothetical protein